MERIRQFVREGFSEFKSIPWEAIPDLGLYMDQVITFVTRAYDPLYGESTRSYLSAPMINNYVKNKLIPRPKGKKYTRMHIALLIMIVVLKHVCTMEDIREMIVYETEEDVCNLYRLFCQRHEKSIGEMLCIPDSDLDPAMDYAIRAAAYHAGSEALLHTVLEEVIEENTEG